MPPSLARHISPLATIALLVVCGRAAQSGEDPMLARSELIAPERAPASEPIKMTFVIRSDADEDALVSCWLNVGEQLLFTGTEKPVAGAFDRDAHLGVEGRAAALVEPAIRRVPAHPRGARSRRGEARMKDS